MKFTMGELASDLEQDKCFVEVEIGVMHQLLHAPMGNEMTGQW
ncbi:MAG: hypothetical protein AAGA85_00710 [Bacteroidota bacterium]